MDVPPALIESLTLLSDALDDPATDLEAILSVLTDDLESAIPSYLGLIVTLHIDGSPVIVSTLDGARNREAQASLMLSLLPVAAGTPASTIAFFSAATGAFDNLADDARWVFNLDGPPVLDVHRAAGRNGLRSAGIVGLTSLTNINQAIGVLIEQGHTPDGARAELARRSVHSGQSLSEAALYVLDNIALPEPTSES